MPTTREREKQPEDLSFTPETLELFAKRTEAMRRDCLCSVDGAGSEDLAEQHYLLALNALEEAERNFKLARIHQARALAAGKR